MLVVDGVGAMLGGLTHGLLQARAYAEAGYSVPLDPHSAGWFAGGVPHLIGGVYLIVGGNWLLRTVFTSSRHGAVGAPHRTDQIDGAELD